MSDNFETRAKVLKVDESLGLVLGWGIISSVDGEPYYDTQGDHIPEGAMIEATTDFMLKSRIAGDMHEGADGQVVFSFPMTPDIAEAFGFVTKTSGWMVGVKPSPEVFEKFKSGEYTGFSIGGTRLEEEVVEE